MFMIQSMIYAKNVSAAYIASESTIGILLKRPEMLDERGHNVFHEIKYTVGMPQTRFEWFHMFPTNRDQSKPHTYYIVSQQVRFVVPSWYMIRRLNMLLRRTVEHGFLKAFEMRTNDLMHMWRTDDGNNALFNDNAMEMLPLEELLFAFVIYAIGLMAALIAFVAEHVKYRLRRRRKVRSAWW